MVVLTMVLICTFREMFKKCIICFMYIMYLFLFIRTKKCLVINISLFNSALNNNHTIIHNCKTKDF